jgi:hypothetical protein
VASHLGIYERRFYDNRWKQVPSHKKVDHNLGQGKQASFPNLFAFLLSPSAVVFALLWEQREHRAESKMNISSLVGFRRVDIAE